MSTYKNGPGNIPRLPDRVVDTLIDSAGVSRCAPGRGINVIDQTVNVERLVHDACEELLARLPIPSPASTAGGARQSVDAPEFRALPPWPEPINAAAHEQETVAPWVTDKQIVDALHSLGIDTEMSKYGFGAIQVCGTNVPNIRRLIAKLAGRSAGERERELCAKMGAMQAQIDQLTAARSAGDAVPAPLYSTRQDAERFRRAIALEDNAEALYAAVLSHAPDGNAIRRAFDSDAAPVPGNANPPEKDS